MLKKTQKPNSSAHFSKGQLLDIKCGCGKVNRRIAGTYMLPCDECKAFLFLCEYTLVEEGDNVSDREPGSVQDGG